MYQAQIKQAALFAGTEGYPSPVPQTKDGVAVFQTPWSYYAKMGLMFNVHENVLSTAINGSVADASSLVLTIPTIRFTVPSGTTVLPRRFDLNMATAAGTVTEVAIVYTDTDTYTSGGTALATIIKNLRTTNGAGGAPPATKVTNAYQGSGTALVEAAMTNPRRLGGLTKGFAAAASAGELFMNSTWEWSDLIPIDGPASFLIFIGAVTTTPSFEFDLTWAEVPTASV